MSITDELRDWFKDRLFMANGWQEIHDIADRIDAEHESACAEAYGNGVQSVALPDMTAYVKLPVDADGVPIRVGDVMEFSAFEIEKPVTRMVDGIGQGVFFAWCGERGYQQHEAKRYRHHHEPTVEDVLCELLDKVDDDRAGQAEIIAEYAAKLRLAKESE